MFPWLTADRIVVTNSLSQLATPSSISSGQSLTLSGSATLTVAGLLTAQSALTVASAVTLSLQSASRVLVTNTASAVDSPTAISTGQSLTLTNASGITTLQAATQDAVRLLGRAGGSSSRIQTITTASLSDSRTLTLPDADMTITGGGTLALGGFTLTVPATGTAALLAQAQTFSAKQTILLNGSAGSPAITSGGLYVYATGSGSNPGIICYDTVNLVEMAFGAFGGSTIFGTITSHTLNLRTANADRLTISSAGVVSLTNTTDASAIGTASEVLAGGLSVAKQIRAGGVVTVLTSGTLGSPAVSSGSLYVQGNGSSSNPWIGCYDNANSVEMGFGPIGGTALLGTITSHGLNIRTANADRLTISSAGIVSITSTNASAITCAGGISTGNTTLHTTTAALTNGAAAQVGTLTNAPSAGNPTKWVPISDNGTTRYIPCW